MTVQFFLSYECTIPSAGRKFIAMNIPYKIVGGVNFLCEKEKLRIFLLISRQSTMDVMMLRLEESLMSQRRGIGLTTINRIQESATERGIGFYEALLAPG